MIALATVVTGVILFSLFVLAVYLICAASWYRIVPPTEAHLVITPKKKFIVSADKEISDISTYFDIPSWIPFFGRTVRMLDLTIKETNDIQETIEKDQARYNVETSTKYQISDIQTAANKFVSDVVLDKQLQAIIRSAVRAVTVQYSIPDARANKNEVEKKIREQMETNMKQYGCILISFQLVDFKDAKDSEVILNISKRQEVSIAALTREQNAEKLKNARIKEAQSDQEAQKQEMERDQQVSLREQEKFQKVAEQNKVTEQKKYDVAMIQRTMEENIQKASAEIQASKEKEIARISAEKDKEVALIQKEALKSQGEGYRANAEEKAKGDAASIREKGLAEAAAKDKLQEALNKFKPEAINALVADKIVEKDRAIGIANADALKAAKINVMAGGNQQGFDIANYLQSIKMVDNSSADALLNRIAKPNDVGFGTSGIPVTPTATKK